MIQEQTLAFLKNLQLNNSKQWLDDNKTAYQNAKNDILNLATKLIASTSDFDTSIKPYLDPKKCITRLHRDLRFTKGLV